MWNKLVDIDHDQHSPAGSQQPTFAISSDEEGSQPLRAGLQKAWKLCRTALTHDGKHVGYHAGLYLEVQRSVAERKHGFKVKTTTRTHEHTQSTLWLFSEQEEGIANHNL